jgi:hypothetical protein
MKRGLWIGIGVLALAGLLTAAAFLTLGSGPRSTADTGPAPSTTLAAPPQTFAPARPDIEITMAAPEPTRRAAGAAPATKAPGPVGKAPAPPIAVSTARPGPTATVSPLDEEVEDETSASDQSPAGFETSAKAIGGLGLKRPTPPATRTGGRLVAAIRDQAYYVSYEPQGGVRLKKLHDAVRGKDFAFEVAEFEQDASVPAPEGFHVERAGEILAAAIALQLEAMKFKVGMQLPRALAPLQAQLGDRFRIDLERFPLRASFSGRVRFTVAHARSGDAFVTTASLGASVQVAAPDRGFLYGRDLQESASASAGTMSGASDRARSTASAAVVRLVAALFSDPQLESSLLAYVGRPGR